MSRFIGTVTDSSYRESAKELKIKQGLSLRELLEKYIRVQRHAEGEVGAAMLVAHYQQKRFHPGDLWGSC